MIETTNLKLKKWEPGDLVTDVLAWYNQNLDTLEASNNLVMPLEVISTADISDSSPVSFTTIPYRLYLAIAGRGLNKGMWIINATATTARANEVIPPTNVSTSIDGLNVTFSATTTVHLSIIRIR